MQLTPRLILESERLLFRNHVEADRDAYCKMEMDADVRRYVGGYPRTHVDADKRFENALNAPQGNLNMWATVLKSNNLYIGRCGLYQHMLSNGSYEPHVGVLAYYIDSEYWNQGFATEAAKAFVGFGFDVLLLQKIITTVEVGNERSVKILEKLGFEVESKEQNGQRSFIHFKLNKL